MNVSELYRELKMTKDEFFDIVHKLGFAIGERAIKIDDRVAVQVIEAIRKQQKELTKTSIFAEEEVHKENAFTEKSEGAELVLPENITVKNFAEKLGKKVPDMMAILMHNGIMATINQQLDYETASIVAEDLGWKPKLSLEEESGEHFDDRAKVVEEILKHESNLMPRPPVIVVMGHVDHGKTSLLDALRETSVTSEEMGGITQHIGAYQVEKKNRLMTFIDTPGHEAFTAMRSRGARVADVAILVVAADDGVKPQTIEAIHILEQSALPFVVAINKIDKPGADIDRVKKELSDLNLIPEDYGGKTICVSVSATQKLHLDDLLDMVLLVADMGKNEIVANPHGQIVGTIIDSHVDKHRGPEATVLIQNGTLRIGDIVQIGHIPGKVRSMKDWQGKNVNAALPSQPVQVLGLRKAPVVGDVLQVVTDKKILRQKVKAYNSFSFLNAHNGSDDTAQGKKKLNIILRADKLGSLEAIVSALQKIQHSEVKVNVLQKGLGNITESDIALAQGSNASIYGFHVDETSGAAKYAADHRVVLKKYYIIYELIDAVKEDLTLLLSSKKSFQKIGQLKVLALFRKEAKYQIIGGRVEFGKIVKNSPIKIFRREAFIDEGTIGQLQEERKNVNEVSTGHECGLRVDSETALQEGDMLEVYEVQETARSLE